MSIKYKDSSEKKDTEYLTKKFCRKVHKKKEAWLYKRILTTPNTMLFYRYMYVIYICFLGNS